MDKTNWLKNLRENLEKWTNNNYVAPIIVYLLFIISILTFFSHVFPQLNIQSFIKLFFIFIISDGFLKLLGVVIWPLVIVSMFYFFRKVFAYLFISMDELNIFGTKFKMKNPIVVIEEQAAIKFKNKQDEEEKLKLNAEKDLQIEKLKEIIDSKTQSVEKYKESYLEAIKLAEGYSADYKNLLEDYKNFIDNMKKITTNVSTETSLESGSLNNELVSDVDEKIVDESSNKL